MKSYKVTLIDEAQGQSTTIEVRDDEYIIDAAKEQGVEFNYASHLLCLTGACSTCAYKLIKGKVDQSDQSFLDDDQLEAGYVLICVAYAESDCTISLYKEDDLS